MADDRLDLGVGHDQPAEPEPVGADPAKQIAIPVEFRAFHSAQGQTGSSGSARGTGGAVISR